MDIKKRGQDLTEIFDSRWQVNHDYQGRKEFLDSRKDHLKRMYDVQDRNNVQMNARRQEILRANSVNGRVENLNQRMDAANTSQRMARLNDFKNNFR